MNGFFRFAAAAALLFSANVARAAGPVVFQISSAGTTTPQAGPLGGDAITSVELDDALAGQEDENGLDADAAGEGRTTLNRTIAKGPGAGSSAPASARAKSNPELKLSFDGVNLHDQRFANNGNQFTVEPPDQALCVGGGQIIEGPWGKVATANLTPDPSGIPYYDEALFIRAIRTGAVGTRELSRAMPWLVMRNMTDQDLGAIFAYLKTLKPVSHRVDNSLPPTLCPLDRAMHGGGDQNQKQ